jgi:hypothetical protein
MIASKYKILISAKPGIIYFRREGHENRQTRCNAWEETIEIASFYNKYEHVELND